MKCPCYSALYLGCRLNYLFILLGEYICYLPQVVRENQLYTDEDDEKQYMSVMGIFLIESPEWAVKAVVARNQ